MLLMHLAYLTLGDCFQSMFLLLSPVDFPFCLLHPVDGGFRLLHPLIVHSACCTFLKLFCASPRLYVRTKPREVDGTMCLEVEVVCSGHICVCQ